MKRADIDWRAREIRIIQHKTGKPLSLPFKPESSNAIAEYLLHARPKCDAPNVFVSHSGIPAPITSTTLSQFICRYKQLAGLDTLSSVGKGFHSFRRAFGTKLLEGEVNLELLRQMMGHSRIDSTTPYLSMEKQGLKSCCIPLITAKGGTSE